MADHSYTLCADPGVKEIAYAMFRAAELKHVGSVKTSLRSDAIPDVSEVSTTVVEKPQIYDSSPNPQTLVDLAMAAQKFADRVETVSGRAVSTIFTLPSEWKGQVKKPIHHQRIWQELSVQERLIVADHSKYSCEQIIEYIAKACTALAVGKKPTYSRKVHNILDAVGIGLWYHKRLARAGAKRK